MTERAKPYQEGLCPHCHQRYPSPGTLRYHIKYAHGASASHGKRGEPKPKLPNLEWHDEEDR